MQEVQQEAGDLDIPFYMTWKVERWLNDEESICPTVLQFCNKERGGCNWALAPYGTDLMSVSTASKLISLVISSVLDLKLFWDSATR
jgi:hypothetical protein